MKDLIALIARVIAALPEYSVDLATDLATKAFDLGYKEGRDKEREEATKALPPQRPMLPNLYPVMQHIRNRQKIQAIKELRTQTNCGLREGKMFVEMLHKMWESGTLPAQQDIYVPF